MIRDPRSSIPKRIKVSQVAHCAAFVCKYWKHLQSNSSSPPSLPEIIAQSETGSPQNSPTILQSTPP